MSGPEDLAGRAQPRRIEHDAARGHASAGRVKHRVARIVRQVVRVVQVVGLPARDDQRLPRAARAAGGQPPRRMPAAIGAKAADRHVDASRVTPPPVRFCERGDTGQYVD